ncbi:hypothetical protein TRIUR3_28881 [Triticum urartu]|uniref:Inositol polyphosphate-related phosphatase domain-containing protein n=1 Tax=Triticum urartu TaxID=4572 RepID=M8A8C1_TRIUA|nr:hypothetical protein TRIUR3_28881 [Triticum urartu]
MDWPQLAEKDQLKRELRKGRAFEGWSEGVLEFAPTYKYEVGTGKYIGDDQKGGRRTPAWCDRVLSFGKGPAWRIYAQNVCFPVYMHENEGIKTGAHLLDIITNGSNIHPLKFCNIDHLNNLLRITLDDNLAEAKIHC